MNIEAKKFAGDAAGFQSCYAGARTKLRVREVGIIQSLRPMMLGWHPYGEAHNDLVIASPPASGARVFWWSGDLDYVSAQSNWNAHVDLSSNALTPHVAQQGLMIWNCLEDRTTIAFLGTLANGRMLADDYPESSAAAGFVATMAGPHHPGDRSRHRIIGDSVSFRGETFSVSFSDAHAEAHLWRGRAIPGRGTDQSIPRHQPGGDSRRDIRWLTDVTTVKNRRANSLLARTAPRVGARREPTTPTPPQLWTRANHC